MALGAPAPLPRCGRAVRCRLRARPKGPSYPHHICPFRNRRPSLRYRQPQCQYLLSSREERIQRSELEGASAHLSASGLLTANLRAHVASQLGRCDMCPVISFRFDFCVFELSGWSCGKSAEDVSPQKRKRNTVRAQRSRVGYCKSRTEAHFKI